MVSIAFIAKIVIGIVWKVKGIFTPGIGWVILFIAAAIFVPMGFTICFIICKLVGVLTLGWLYKKNGSESSRQLLETANKNLNDIERKNMKCEALSVIGERETTRLRN